MANLTFDVDSIKNRILSNLIGKENWKNILYYSTSIPLVEAFAEEIHDLSTFNMYLTNENTWRLAKNYSSLLAMQDLLSYTPRRKVSSKGFIIISTSKNFDTSYGEDISILSNTIFQTENNISFVIDNDNEESEYILLSDDKFISLPIIQGVRKTNTITITDAVEFNSIIISEDNIEDESLKLFVNDEKWEPINSIFSATENEKVYQIYRDPNSLGLKLIFGSDRIGKKLVRSDVVRYEYIVSDGEIGNIYSINSIIKINQQGLDTGGNYVSLYCTNDSIVVGGKEEETIDEIRANAPQKYQTGDRCQNNADYKYILTHDPRLSFIKKCIVWGYEDILLEGDTLFSFNVSENPVVHIAMLNDNFEDVDVNVYQDSLREVLLEKKNPTDVIKFESSEIIKMAIISDITLTTKSFLLENIKNLVKQTLSNSYGIDLMDYFKHVSFAEIYDKINNILKVNGNLIGRHITYYRLIINSFLNKISENNYVSNFSINILSVKPGSISIYSSDVLEETGETLIAQDTDPEGSITSNGVLFGVGAFKNFVRGYINYNTGLGYIYLTGIDIISLNKYSLKIFWQNITEGNDDISDIILTKRQQIIGYSDSDSLINVSYSKGK